MQKSTLYPTSSTQKSLDNIKLKLLKINIKKIESEINSIELIINKSLDELFAENPVYKNMSTVFMKKDTPVNSESVESEIKTLKRKINIKCHPDKTDKTELHDLFQEARNVNSLEDLKLIYDCIDDNNSDFYVSKLRRLNKQLETLKLSNSFRIAQLYTSNNHEDKIQSRILFVTTLLKSITKFESHE